MNVLFVGGGNMGRALIGGMLAQRLARESILAIEIDAGARQRLRDEFGIGVLERIEDASAPGDVIAAVDVVVIAVKPQHMRATAVALGGVLTRQLVISIAAGIRIADLSRWLGGDARIIRAMPNTPALIRRGITGLFAPAETPAGDRAAAETILGAVGETLWIAREEQLDALTALSGSGPAYVFHFLESMIEAGEALGFTRDEARLLAYRMASGAIALAEASAESPATLRAQVTSKGGTTAAALAVLEQRGVKAAYVLALKAAAERGAQMGDSFGRDDR